MIASLSWRVLGNNLLRVSPSETQATDWTCKVMLISIVYCFKNQHTKPWSSCPDPAQDPYPDIHPSPNQAEPNPKIEPHPATAAKLHPNEKNWRTVKKRQRPYSHQYTDFWNAPQYNTNDFMKYGAITRREEAIKGWLLASMRQV